MPQDAQCPYGEECCCGQCHPRLDSEDSESQDDGGDGKELSWTMAIERSAAVFNVNFMLSTSVADTLFMANV